MKKSVSLVVAVLLAGSASLAVAQTGVGAGNVSTGTGLSYQTPAQLNPGAVGQIAHPASAAANFPLGACDPAGCWGVDGARYDRDAGNVLFGSNGKICQFVAPGAPLMCD
jgi:hypothetical protein